MFIRKSLIPGAVLLAVGAMPLLAEVTIPNIFSSGETAVADDVNANFDALKTALESALERIDTLETNLAAVQANNALAMGDHVEVIADPNYPNQYTVRFSGVNVQIVNGEGSTGTTNGLGNLIVGYNGARTSYAVCSIGSYDNQTDCENASETWAQDHKSGSHNIVGGSGNAYSSFGGLVVGEGNVTNGPYAGVSAGRYNTASGSYSSVSGGTKNSASGVFSSVSGGDDGTAAGYYSSILGGTGQTVVNDYDIYPPAPTP